MLAARQDQENAAERRRGVATNKSLPKTPTGKVGGVRSRSDENKADHARLTVGKEKSQAFITPTGRTIRAPLGAKATNGKGFLLRTPSQPVNNTRPVPSTTTKRTRRTQFKVHQPSETNDGEEVRDIEYMPPRGESLPDLPDEDLWPHDRTYEQLEGENFTKGWSWHIKSLDEDSDFEEEYRQALSRESRIEWSKLACSETVHYKTEVATTSISEAPPARLSRGFAAATKASTARSKGHPLIGNGHRQPQQPLARRPHTVGSQTAHRNPDLEHQLRVERHRGEEHSAGVVTSPHDFSNGQTLSDNTDLDDFSAGNVPRDLLELEGLYAFKLDLPDE